MSADELAHAFQAFYRGNNGQGAGHGIGLTIVKRLSDRFGWPVDIESAPGIGTVATVRFPVVHPV